MVNSKGRLQLISAYTKHALKLVVTNIINRY